MNTAKIYAKGTGQEAQPSDEEVAQKNASLMEEQNKKASKEAWRRHPLTREFFFEINSEVSKLDNLARELAMNYHQTNNHNVIIQTLVKAETLRKLVTDTDSK